MLILLANWLIWRQSVQVEEERVSELARELGERVESAFLGAIETMESLNEMPHTPCSVDHQQAMNDSAIGKSYIKAIGYWRADERLCGVGYVQLMQLRPPKADKIYPSGLIAWWPSEYTEFGGVRLFLLRFGEHDVAIDPDLLLTEDPMQSRQAALWLEGLRIGSTSLGNTLPSPSEIPVGMMIDSDAQRVLSRFSPGTELQIDVVVMEPIAAFWDRYESTMIAIIIAGILLAIVWTFLITRYSRHRFSLTTELREAIRQGKLDVVYQPIVELSTRRCVGGEALVRWARKGGEMVSPDIFIPLATRARLLPEITRSVLRKTLKDLGPLLRENPDLKINLNLGPEDSSESKFANQLDEQIKRANVSAASIKLEITERSLVNTDIARAQIKSLREAGHSIAVDDFGTGYSSLAYLESFELDTLKIDKSFVDAIDHEAVTGNVIPHIIEMAKSLDLDTVAEGIEVEHQVEWLLERGVKYGQGFLFSKPLDKGAFVQFVQNNSGHQTTE